MLGKPLQLDAAVDRTGRQHGHAIGHDWLSWRVVRNDGDLYRAQRRHGDAHPRPPPLLSPTDTHPLMRRLFVCRIAPMQGL